ncbi:hypothetical protein pVco7_gp029 [Vibrio phage pVco-7]|uniref:Uncharacterized protein n=1 Tax=Vibrio phage pVco-5 TaxID=1965485 RepID=A0A1W6JUS0_9CAUD|nr:hypothetical protein KNT61_gp030 [Vibrio phage pVco-5]ARM71018.1 hypothetical protein pVco5_030 [Vibrio phage pVco-5]
MLLIQTYYELKHTDADEYWFSYKTYDSVFIQNKCMYHYPELAPDVATWIYNKEIIPTPRRTNGINT